MAIQHYEGRLGKFDYNDNEFKLNELQLNEFLKYIGKETNGSKIKIPEGIKYCNHMFSGYKNLEKAPVIPEGVIDCSSMFEGCKNLKEAPVIPESVDNCKSMFKNCYNLKKSPMIHKNIRNGEYMFEGCIKLEKVPVIPENVELCDYMFKDCTDDIQRAGEWNIRYHDMDYYTDGPGKNIKTNNVKTYTQPDIINALKEYTLDNLTADISNDDAFEFVSLLTGLSVGALAEYVYDNVPKTDKLTDWWPVDEDIEVTSEHVKNIFRKWYKNELTITRGRGINIDQIFGLPYTSTSDYAALWNCQATAHLNKNPQWKFRALAISTKHEVIAVFDREDTGNFDQMDIIIGKL